MRILVLSDEAWNDKTNGNNVISNWFTGINAEFANIYASPGVPYNSCCNKYFQVTDWMMFKSIFLKKKAGKIVTNYENNNTIVENENKKIYKFLKVITGNFLRLIRELIWLIGRYDKKELEKFVNEFNPDIIFTERMASCKILRLERIVSSIQNKPLFAFTGDDEYSLKQISFSPFFWIRRFMIRYMLRRNVKKYEIYYTLSEEQKNYYEKIFGCKCKILQKCGSFDDEYKEHNINYPIKLIYAGKFYCNRWKVLVKIATAIKEINEKEIKMVLEIYTKDIPNKKQNKYLNDRKNSFIMGSVTQEQLNEIYKKSDIALHVESDDIKNRLITRFSFSTKIIDCVFSGCAVLAYCWKEQSGWKYLKRENSAICVSTYKQLKEELIKICNEKKIINYFSYRAYLCGLNNHNKLVIQANLINDFKKSIKKNRG